MNSQIKAIVYDFGGVLLSYEGVSDKWRQMSVDLGLDAATMHEEIVSINFSTWLGKDRSLFLGTVSVDEIEDGLFVNYLREKYGDKIKADAVVRPYSECLRGSNIKLHHKMVETVRILHSKGFKTAMLTNNMYLDKEHKETRLPFNLSHFDQVVESCVESLMKPDPRFYKLVEQRLGVQPNEIVFLDDLKENTDAAEKLGWNTILVSDNDEAISKLSEITGVQF